VNKDLPQSHTDLQGHVCRGERERERIARGMEEGRRLLKPKL